MQCRPAFFFQVAAVSVPSRAAFVSQGVAVSAQRQLAARFRGGATISSGRLAAVTLAVTQAAVVVGDSAAAPGAARVGASLSVARAGPFLRRPMGTRMTGALAAAPGQLPCRLAGCNSCCHVGMSSIGLSSGHESRS